MVTSPSLITPLPHFGALITTPCWHVPVLSEPSVKWRPKPARHQLPRGQPNLSLRCHWLQLVARNNYVKCSNNRRLHQSELISNEPIRIQYAGITEVTPFADVSHFAAGHIHRHTTAEFFRCWNCWHNELVLFRTTKGIQWMNE